MGRQCGAWSDQFMGEKWHITESNTPWSCSPVVSRRYRWWGPAPVGSWEWCWKIMGHRSRGRRGARHGIRSNLALRISLGLILGAELGISFSWLAGTLCAGSARRRNSVSSFEVEPRLISVSSAHLRPTAVRVFASDPGRLRRLSEPPSSLGAPGVFHLVGIHPRASRS